MRSAPTQTKRLLVINPNTSVEVTALLQQHIRTQLLHNSAQPGPAYEVEATTAHFGPAYISSEVAYTIASHACLDAWAGKVAGHNGALLPWDGIVIGCFGDPGLLAMRELAPIPVTGLAEGAFTVAAQHGNFGIVTGGERWRPMLQRLAQALHCDHTLKDIATVELTGAQLMANRPAALEMLRQACQQQLQTHEVDAIIIGGAALTGMAAEIQAHVAVPLIDSVHAAARHISHQMRCEPPTQSPQPCTGAAVRWSGLSTALEALLANRA
ncbi:Asp/Glu racemase [Lampropedia puyangensis]|uniref:Asp/Glu racemase n=1 Tax=Lampropedia puyangensis TaxID=1330072 RepID=A0A4V4GRD3_9BURK|nr:aspartate/glutamate racemase family protein [Lampropedia puyangensis]THU01456.1 Asp/Glu racemase [Lampropedia puyangensis]